MQDDLVSKLEQENTFLRAALAVSKDPCTYCQLPAEEMAKCKSGFPGCGRADDMMGCPEFGASLRAKELEEALRHCVVLATAYMGGHKVSQGLKEYDPRHKEIVNRAQRLIGGREIP